MARRVLTAIPLAILVLWLVIQNREWPFVLALVVTVEIGLYEFFAMAKNAGLPRFAWIGYVGGAALCLAQVAALHRIEQGIPLALLLVVIAIPIAGLFSPTTPEAYFASIATTFLGIAFVPFLLSWLIPLRFSDPQTGRPLVVLMFLVTWAADSFAFLVGRRFGRIFVYPRISPRKTLEGSIAGLAGAVLVGFLFGRYYWKAPDGWMVLILSLVIAVAGQAGDLVESAMKRQANVKDSSGLLPGHGGILDRIDSLMFAAPVLWLLWEFRGLWHR